MSKKTAADIVKDYEAGYLSKQDLYMSILLAADQGTDYDLVVAQVPAEYMDGFVECVMSYIDAESRVQVGCVRVDGPKPETIAGLQAALGGRLGARQSS